MLRKTVNAGFAALALVAGAVSIVPVSADTGGGYESGPRPRVCLALGGGGARGAAHVGVLRALEDMRVPVDCIAGTSIGAIVGSLYAMGMDIEGLEAVVRTTDWDAMFSDRPPRGQLSFRRRQDDLAKLVDFDIGLNQGELKFPRGLIQGQNLQVFLRRLSKRYALEKDFDRLPIPFRAVATDLERGESKVFSSGELSRAVRASMAVPAIFAPVSINGRLYVDGGLLANVPVEAARSMGADVIIAVDVGYPLRQREDLDSAFNIADQTVTLMMLQGTKRQFGALQPGDVTIVPALGDASSAEFNRGDEFMDLGEAATRTVASDLSRYALPAEDYARHLAARAAVSADVPAPMVRSVRVSNDSKMSAEAIKARLGQGEGQRLDLDALERDLQRIYGLGVFETVDYVLTPVEDDVALSVQAKKKSWGPNFLNLGLLVEERFDGDGAIAAKARYSMTQVNKLGAEWRTDLQLGFQSYFFTEFYQPLSYGSPYFIAPQMRLFRRTLDIYEDGSLEPLGEVGYRAGDIGIALGKELGSWAEIRVGVNRGKIRRGLQVGDPQDPRLQSRDFDVGEVDLSFSIDTLDRVPFSSSGTLLFFEATAGREQLGASSDFERYRMIYQSAWSIDKNYFYLGGEWGATRSSEDQGVLFSLGGFLRLSGLAPDQLTGQQMGLAKAIYARKLGLGGFGSLPLYAGSSVEYGGAWQERSQVNWSDAIFAGSAFLAADTFLGAVYLAGGFAEGDRYSMYLAIGREF